MTVHHPGEGEWMAWVERQTNPEESHALEIHFHSCPHCRRRVEAMRAAAESIQMLKLPLPASLVEGTRASLFQALPGRLEEARDRAVRAALGDGLADPSHHDEQGRGEAVRTLLGSGRSAVNFDLPSAITTTAGVFLAVLLLAWTLWMSTGSWAYMDTIFHMSYAAFLIFFAAAECLLAVLAMRLFAPGTPLRASWLLISLSAGCRLSGLLVSTLGPHNAAFSDPNLAAAGRFIASPVALFTLGAALLQVRGAYESLGLRARLRVADYAVLIFGAAELIRHGLEVGGIMANGPSKDLLTMLNWLSQPALFFVLATAISLRRAALAEGGGLASHCWGSIAAGSVLTLLGNWLLTLENYGYLLWPWNSLSWFVWVPASAAFALGPAYQLAASGLLVRAAAPAEQSR